MQQVTRRILKGAGVLIVLSLLLSVSVFAQSHGRVVNRVTVGGPDADITVFGVRDANYALIAVEYEDGFVRGQFIDRYHNDVSDPGNDGGLRGEITCLSIDGDSAWVTGNVISGSVAPYFFARVRDNGNSANDPPDEIGFGIPFGNPFFLDCDLQITPEFFPPGTPFAPLFRLLPMPDGQVKVN